MLRIQNLSKTYPNGVKALQDVTLEIPRGMFGLLGENGAGKSTLMRTIATLQAPDTGSIMLDDLDVLKQKEDVRKVLGYLPQEFGVYPRISALAMLDHFALLKGITNKSERNRVVEGLLQQTNLWKERKRRLDSYSGGMKQRFGIAQALLGDPRLIIVDEPTAGLDPEERNRFHNLLAEIGENVVVLLSTHIVEDVRDLCSQMAIISKGEVLLSGRPEEIIRGIDGKIWEREIEKTELEAYEREHNVISTRLYGGRTLIHVHAEAAPPGFAPVTPDLKDVYFSALKRVA
ncbi:MAG: ABC transporter ATP-binding protein [Gemmatimonadetes bacterium]|nr:ABC transporter ATP-binding protein [Gemmatimonadota bacterium]